VEDATAVFICFVNAIKSDRLFYAQRQKKRFSRLLTVGNSHVMIQATNVGYL